MYKELKWGEYSLLSLYISVLSGIAVALQYDPDVPLYSISTIDLLIPYGAYFRSLHFYSSQFFFLFCVCHVIAIFSQSQHLSRKQWIRLIATLPVALLILFTGYILRGDTTGYSAGMIGESILLDVPYFGKALNNLLFSISDNGMKRIYVNHIIGFGLLWGWLARKHVKKYTIDLENHIFLIIATFLFPIFVYAPFEPEQLGTTHITGPWFFVGLQELLRYFPPMLAGVLFPMSLLVAVAFLQKSNPKFYYILFFVLGWFCLYALLTGIGLTR